MAGEDWARAAEYVEIAAGARGLNRRQFAEAAGVDPKTVANFLDHHRPPRQDKWRGYEEAVGWASGSLLRTARGGEPTLVDAASRPDMAFVAEGGPKVEASLEERVSALIADRHEQMLRDVAEMIRLDRDEHS